jgi:hypothetical protein
VKLAQRKAVLSTIVFSSVVASAQSRHSKVHNSGSAPRPGMARAKRIGFPHFGQIGVGLFRSVVMLAIWVVLVRPALR